MEVLEGIIRNPDFDSFDSDSSKREHLAYVLKEHRKRFLSGVRLDVRERQSGELDRIEEYQRKLESRSRQPKPGEVMKLSEPEGAKSLQSHMRWKGREESANVEDQRARPRAGWTEEDGQVLADEVLSAGPSPVDDAEAARAALLLDGLDEQRFASFARSLDENVQMGRLARAHRLSASTCRSSWSGLDGEASRARRNCLAFCGCLRASGV